MTAESNSTKTLLKTTDVISLNVFSVVINHCLPKNHYFPNAGMFIFYVQKEYKQFIVFLLIICTSFIILEIKFNINIILIMVSL